MAALLVAGLVPALPETPYALAEDVGAVDVVELGGEGVDDGGSAIVPEMDEDPIQVEDAGDATSEGVEPMADDSAQ